MTVSKLLKIVLAVVVSISGILACMFVAVRPHAYEIFNSVQREHLFEIQSIDTMKFSRDMAGQVNDNPEGFTSMIDKQMALIKNAGATHVGIATPYDERFIPALKAWVSSARRHGLSVWYRGNFSGWEGWFEESKIDREKHKELLRNFLVSHPELFVDGDVFTPCPECENGGPGDPRQTGDKVGYNRFLVEEYGISSAVFAQQGKSITIVTSMNGDIAREIITPRVARELGGIILVDHYVDSASKFGRDLDGMANILESRIGLGEFGGPIPDIHGDLTKEDQAKLVSSLLYTLYLRNEDIPAINYWTLSGGSTALASDEGEPRPAYYAVQAYYKAPMLHGNVYNTLGDLIGNNVTIIVNDTDYRTKTDNNSFYQVFLLHSYRTVTVSAEGYEPQTFTFPTSTASTSLTHDFYLKPKYASHWYNMRKYLLPYLSKN